jgi:pyruvate dehydrogenase E2 component (dihydrolipoamide acetyltransferase)
MAKTEVTVPDIGDYKDVPVIEVLVRDGERVEKDSALITLESEKATMEVPAPAGGVVRDIRVKVGDKVSQGDVIMALEGESAPAAPAAEAGGRAAPSAPVQAARGRDTPPAPARSAHGRGPADSSVGAAHGRDKPAETPRGSMEITVPDIGDYKDVPVIEVLVKDGDAVDKDAPLIVLESEKATMEVPSPAAGTVRGVALKAGAKVSKGARIATLELAPGAVPAKVPDQPRPAPDTGPREEEKPAPERPKPSRPEPSAAEAGVPPWVGQARGEMPHASPFVRKIAREFGVDLARVQGSGPRGRILAEDVQGYTKKALAGGGAAGSAGAGIPAMPAVDFSQWGEVEHKPLARIRRISAQYLHRAWLNVPHVTQHDEADITELEAFRKAQSAELGGKEGGVKLTLLPIVMKAVGAALRQFPVQRLARAGRREPGPEEVLQHRLCRRHRGRARRAGGEGRVGQGHRAARRRMRRACEEGARRQAQAG